MPVEGALVITIINDVHLSNADLNNNVPSPELENILEPLRDTFQSKLKDICPIGQEIEKVQELKRSAMRTVIALSKLPDAGLPHGVFMISIFCP